MVAVIVQKLKTLYSELEEKHNMLKHKDASKFVDGRIKEVHLMLLELDSILEPYKEKEKKYTCFHCSGEIKARGTQFHVHEMKGLYIKETVGFGSKHDLDTFEIAICDNCLEEYKCKDNENN